MPLRALAPSPGFPTLPADTPVRAALRPLFAEHAGRRIRCFLFMLGAFPLMSLSIAVSHLYIGWRYLT